MRLLLQRVREGKVTIEGQDVAAIGKGLVVLVGFGPEDTLASRGGKLWNMLIEKMVGLRIFPDDEGKMNRGIEEAGGEIILVSQFTLYADSRKGRRPSFHLSAPSGVAFAPAEKHQRRDGTYSVPTDAFRVGRIVDIQLDDAQPVAETLFELCEYRPHHFARPAPRGVEIHQYGRFSSCHFVEIVRHFFVSFHLVAEFVCLFVVAQFPYRSRAADSGSGLSDVIKKV